MNKSGRRNSAGSSYPIQSVLNFALYYIVFLAALRSDEVNLKLFFTMITLPFFIQTVGFSLISGALISTFRPLARNSLSVADARSK